MPEYKIAKNLVAGDCVMVQRDPHHIAEPATVLGVVESVKIVRRKMIIVTVRGPDGRDIQRIYGPMRTLPLVRAGA